MQMNLCGFFAGLTVFCMFIQQMTVKLITLFKINTCVFYYYLTRQTLENRILEATVFHILK
jgi:hypothetical protein